MSVTSSEITVVIPVYKSYSSLTSREQSSFIQCIKVLQNYKVVLLGPKKLDIADYINYCEKQHKVLGFEPFHERYFKNVNTYSSLLLSPEFYERFINSTYILIYQLDAWVFTDNLTYWCNQGYDFIGAPIFENFEKNTDFSFSYALNGGLSLRNVQSSIRILSRMKPLKYLHFVVKILSLKRIRSLAGILTLGGLKNKLKIEKVDYLRELLGGIRINNEDLKWSWAAETFSDFKKPEPDVAMQFSFEFHPSFLLKKNNNILPMGCHAWEKYEPDFWEKFIPSLQ